MKLPHSFSPISLLPAVTGLLLAILPQLTSAAPVTWDAPQRITGASDVFTEGSLFGTWAPYHVNAANYPVNGVTFQGNEGLGNADLGITSSGFAPTGGPHFAPHTTADSNYNTLLNYGVFSNGPTASFTLNGSGTRPLTVGRQYLVQVWVSDARNINVGLRSQTLSGSGEMVFPANGTGMGSWVIGRFTADATSQQFDITANQSAQINLLQVRDITSVIGEASAYFDGAVANTWNTTTAAWSLASGGPYSLSWSSANAGRAILEGTGGPVNVADPITLRSIRFDSPGYSLDGTGPLTLIGDSILNTGTSGATISCPIDGTEGITKLGDSTLVLTTANQWSGPTVITEGILELNRETATDFTGSTFIFGSGTLRKSGAGEVRWGVAAATFALGSGSMIEVTGGTLVGGSHGTEVWTYNRSGLHVASGAVFSGVEANVRVDALTGAGTLTSGFPGAGYKSLTFGVDGGSGTFDGILADSQPGWNGSFVKTGSGTQTLTGFNTYTGSTRIDEGTLALSQACLSDAAAVAISANGILHLAHSTTDTIGTLDLAGVPATAGLWGRIGSKAAFGADFESALITGNGLLNVTSGPLPPARLFAWLQEKITDIDPLADATPTGDADGDGLTNATEFAFDGDPLSNVSSGKIVSQLIKLGEESVLTLTLPIRNGAVFASPGAPADLELVSAPIDGVIYRIQGSNSSLTNWTQGITEITGAEVTLIQQALPALSSGWQYRTFRTPGSTATESAEFIRAAITVAPLPPDEPGTSAETIYTVSGDAIIRENGPYFNNRPLYCRGQAAVAMAGDKPLIFLSNNPLISGTFLAAVVRDGSGRWLHQFEQTLMLYRPGRLEWQLSDPSLPGLTATLELVTMDQTAGMVVRLNLSGAQESDQLLWAFGGARLPDGVPGGLINWKLDPLMNPSLQRGFLADDCLNNQVSIHGDVFQVALPSQGHVAAGRCDTPSQLFIADATAWADPAALLAAGAATPPTAKPLLCGVIDLSSAPAPIHWAIEDFPVPTPTPEGLQRLANPANTYEAGLQRAHALAGQVVAETPVDWLDVAASAVAASIDAAWYPPVYMHGGMAWNIPFPGWRTTFGPTTYGWHDNVKAQIQYYISAQTTVSNQTEPIADPALGLSQQAKTSRFYGKGHISKDMGFYNFQTQFFDQAVHAWRSTNDPDLEAILFPALELHLEWQKDCFDPDGDGLYESYINTWPTDSVWFNGSGSAEETSYAYTGHRAAAEMATRAGDTAKAEFHQQMAEHIRTALLDLLWSSDRGHVGTYREQMGLNRLHEDAWLYSIFLPIDAGMLPWEKAAQALHYTEWALEREHMPFGGQRCWASNWVPSHWSVREMYEGDNHHLALAYYQTGLPEAAWELVRGTIVESMLNQNVPGAVNVPRAGTDFNDASSMTARVIVEGLFGYQPDYPNDMVTMRPGLPREWNHASFRTPDFSLRFLRTGNVDQYDFTLQKAARMRIELPVPQGEVTAVLVDGEPATWQAVPGIGRTMVVVETNSTQAASVTLTWSEIPQAVGNDSILVKGNAGEAVTLAVAGAQIVEFTDPQQALTGAALTQGAITAQLKSKAGHRLVLALAEFGTVRQWRQFKIETLDPVGDAARAAQTLAQVPAGVSWKKLDLAGQLNGDIRTIFQQQYLSPRPNTSSLRIGSNGYSPWTFYYWGAQPPAIDLSYIPMLVGGGSLNTPQGAPFQWSNAGPNIAFTSQWDNWPNAVTVPVNQTAEAAWFLVCGSTNPMQGHFVNGRLVLRYADGIEDVLELIPPFNYWSLAPFGGSDYDYERDGFCLPKTPPPMVQLGNNCRAMVLNRKLRTGVPLESVTLESLSQEVVIGLMGVSLMNPE